MRPTELVAEVAIRRAADVWTDEVDQVWLAAEEAIHDHGPLTRNLQRAVGILMEEAGEVQKACNDYTRPGPSPTASRELREQLVSELRQTAATAILLLINLEEEG